MLLNLKTLSKAASILGVWMVLNLSAQAADSAFSGASGEAREWSMTALVAWACWFSLTKQADVMRGLTDAVKELVVIVKAHDEAMRLAHDTEVKQLVAVATENKGAK